MQELIAKVIRVIILGALFYYVIIDHSNNPKDLSVPVERANRIGEDVVNIHDAKGQLVELGYVTRPRLVFDRSLIYPVVLGMDIFREFRLKEFEHYSFQYKNLLVQMTYV